MFNSDIANAAAAGLTIMSVAAILVTVSITFVANFDLTAPEMCPGSAAFCDRREWGIIAEYLPWWLYFGLIAVFISMASPLVIAKFGR